MNEQFQLLESSLTDQIQFSSSIARISWKNTSWDLVFTWSWLSWKKEKKKTHTFTVLSFLYIMVFWET